MSISNKTIAPPVIGPMDLLGIEGKIILIEGYDNMMDDLENTIKDKCNIILSASPNNLSNLELPSSVHVQIKSIYSAVKIMRACTVDIDNFIIDRIDMLDLNVNKRVRGSQIKAYLSMLSPKILRSRNLIVTSCQHEYTIRNIADKYISLRTQTK